MGRFLEKRLMVSTVDRALPIETEKFYVTEDDSGTSSRLKESNIQNNQPVRFFTRIRFTFG